MHLALAGSLLLRLLEDLLDDLLLLNQESTDDAVLDATGAAGTTVGAADVLLGPGDLGVLAGAEGGNLKGHDDHQPFLLSFPFIEQWCKSLLRFLGLPVVPILIMIHQSKRAIHTTVQ